MELFVEFDRLDLLKEFNTPFRQNRPNLKLSYSFNPDYHSLTICAAKLSKKMETFLFVAKEFLSTIHHTEKDYPNAFNEEYNVGVYELKCVFEILLKKGKIDCIKSLLPLISSYAQKAQFSYVISLSLSEQLERHFWDLFKFGRETERISNDKLKKIIILSCSSDRKIASKLIGDYGRELDSDSIWKCIRASSQLVYGHRRTTSPSEDVIDTIKELMKLPKYNANIRTRIIDVYYPAAFQGNVEVFQFLEKTFGLLTSERRAGLLETAIRNNNEKISELIATDQLLKEKGLMSSIRFNSPHLTDIFARSNFSDDTFRTVYDYMLKRYAKGLIPAGVASQIIGVLNKYHGEQLRNLGLRGFTENDVKRKRIELGIPEDYHTSFGDNRGDKRRKLE
jgi:hypothetical protein